MKGERIMAAKREGRWDCESCGKVGNLGRNRTCESCGKPRPENVKFYLPENAPAVTDPELLKQAEAGADWYCLHCDAGNSNADTTCKQCGAARGSSPTHKVTDYKLADAPRESPQKQIANPISRPHRTEPKGPVVYDPKVPRSQVKVALWFIGGAAVLVAILLIIFWQRDIPATVSGFSWERSAEIESFQTVQESGWSIPEGGIEVSREWTFHHNDQVFDHYETRYREVCQDVFAGYVIEEYQDCNYEQVDTETYTCGERDLGNGFFEDVECERPIYDTVCEDKTRQVPTYTEVCTDEPYQHEVTRPEPIYANRYTYLIDKWVFVRDVNLSENNHEPFWPDLAANERRVSANEKFVVYFRDQREVEYTRRCDFIEWSNYDLGQRVKLKVNNLDQVTKVTID